MNYILSDYKPKAALKIFEDLCAIPHGSGNEKGIADYIEAFANARGLFSLRDETGNIFLRKEATAGYEETPAILLQGHMDMVCEKNADSNHDFEKDPLKLSVKDGFLWADNTTLGGDDGIAVAMMLALLDTDRHPRLECLFTVEEETGLAGAKGFDCSLVTARRMINLDSEEEGAITAGCAGGMRTEITLPCHFEEVKGETALTVSVKGLAGGHSGVDIDSGKSNAVILMGRLLSCGYSQVKFAISDLTCRGKDNAIARECFATVTVAPELAESLKNALRSEAERIKKELVAADEGFSVAVVPTKTEKKMSDTATSALITLLSCLRTGVLKMSNHIKGLVEYSRNLGVAETDENAVSLTLSTRSSVEAQLDMAIRELDALSAVCFADCRHYARYPGWEYEPQSPLRDAYLAAYKALYGKDLPIAVIHAGLECGILSSKTPGMDIISIGPDIHDIHSPEEHLDLASAERIWQVLLTVVTRK